MDEYIERDEAIRKAIDACIKVVGHGITQFDAVDIAEAMDSIPADVVEVRHGTWHGTIVNNVRRVDCSECGATYALVDIEGDLQDLFYCPNCGAKMDGKDGAE